jgi:hypothetical protein
MAIGLCARGYETDSVLGVLLQVCVNTGDAGGDGTSLFKDDPRILGMWCVE